MNELRTLVKQAQGGFSLSNTEMANILNTNLTEYVAFITGISSKLDDYAIYRGNLMWVIYRNAYIVFNSREDVFQWAREVMPLYNKTPLELLLVSEVGIEVINAYLLGRVDQELSVSITHLLAQE